LEGQPHLPSPGIIFLTEPVALDFCLILSLYTHAARPNMPATPDEILCEACQDLFGEDRHDKTTKRQNDKTTKRQNDKTTKRQNDKTTKRQNDKTTKRQSFIRIITTLILLEKH
jgi:hypothetical protein